MERGRLVGVVLLVSIVFLLSMSFVSANLFSDAWNKITGRVTSGTCTETDGGSNIYVKGALTYGSTVVEDFCRNDPNTGEYYLVEYYCTASAFTNAGVSCINNGLVCSNGACVSSGGGSGGGGSGVSPTCTNECSSGAKQCVGNGYKTCGNSDTDNCYKWSGVENCGSERVCSNGECVTVTCTDSDGINYYVKGSCYDNIESTPANPLWDYCSGNTLAEMRCTAGGGVCTTVSPFYDCSSEGSVCVDGACVAAGGGGGGGGGSICPDTDGDGYSIEGGSCGLIDCDDDDSSVYPRAGEVCDSIDNNCDNNIDEGALCPPGQSCSNGECVSQMPDSCVEFKAILDSAWHTRCGETNYDARVDVVSTENSNCYIDYYDMVEFSSHAYDGVWCTGKLSQICIDSDNDGDGYSIEGGSCGLIDCDDDDNSINPGAIEVCDGKDNDCDGIVDTIEGCVCSEGETKQCGTTDVGECGYGTQICADNQWQNCIGNIEPTDEVCDGKDNDCDGIIDDDLNCEVYCDQDSDDYAPFPKNIICWPLVVGHVSADCDDSDNSINPGAIEVCDGKDNDCDNNIDGGALCPLGQSCSNGECVQSGVCRDSDGGYNYYVKGITTGISANNVSVNITDYCIYSNLARLSNFLVEWGCSSSGKYVTNTMYNCSREGKVCVGGACAEPTLGACTDTDGGKNYYVKGITTGLWEYPGLWDNVLSTKTDDCTSGNTSWPNFLVEHFCVGDYGIDTFYNCSSEGKVCVYGKCVESGTIPISETCTDSDYGYNQYYIKGTTTQGTQSSTDYCEDISVGEPWLIEYYCRTDINRIGSKGFSCGSERVCSDGACISRGCTNECTRLGGKQCVGTAEYKVCGNSDDDSCLEWSNVTNCPAGKTCRWNGC